MRGAGTGGCSSSPVGAGDSDVARGSDFIASPSPSPSSLRDNTGLDPSDLDPPPPPLMLAADFTSRTPAADMGWRIADSCIAELTVGGTVVPLTLVLLADTASCLVLERRRDCIMGGAGMDFRADEILSSLLTPPLLILATPSGTSFREPDLGRARAGLREEGSAVVEVGIVHTGRLAVGGREGGRVKGREERKGG